MKKFGLPPAHGQIGLRYAGIRANYDRLRDPFPAEKMAFMKLGLEEIGQQDPHSFAGTARREIVEEMIEQVK